MIRARTHHRPQWALATWIVALSPGCVTISGELGGVDDSASAGETDADANDDAVSASGMAEGDTGEPGEPEACALVVGASPERILTRRQYENTIEDLFKLPREIWSGEETWDFWQNGRIGPFPATYENGELAPGFAGVAAAVSASVEPATFLPCTLPAADPDACAETFVTNFGRAAWRRPLTDDEIATLMGHYDGTDLETGTSAVILELLSSSNMWILHRTGTPADEDPDILILDDLSMATRLSFFLWNSTPDAELLDRVAAGDLSDADGLLAEAERMLLDPRADRMQGDLYMSLTGIDALHKVEKDAEIFPQFGPSLLGAMEQEFRYFVSDAVLGSGGGQLATLLKGPYTFVNDALVDLYGDDLLSVDGTPGPNTYVRAELDPSRRAGMLTLPAVMTNHSHQNGLDFVRRGIMMRQNILCQALPPPPPDVVVDPIPEPLPDNRYELWNTVIENPTCTACHQLIDPLNFAFDNYDAIGQWQTEINGHPVETAGELIGVDTLDGTTFEDSAELVDQLADTTVLSQCMARQHLRFALRRAFEVEHCEIDDLATRLQQSDGDLRGLMLDIVTSDMFRAARDE